MLTLDKATDSGFVTQQWLDTGYTVGSPLRWVRTPASISTWTGNRIYAEAQALGRWPLTFAWFKDGVPIPSDGYNGNVGNIVIASPAPSDSGIYTVVVSNAFNVLQATFTITVTNRANPHPVTITVQPMTQVIQYGNELVLSVTNSGTQPCFYHWFKNSEMLSAVDGNFLRVPFAQPIDSGTYFVVISNIVNVITSQVAIVVVTGASSRPVIMVQPTSPAIARGSNATLEVSAEEGASYQWFFRRRLITGETNRTLLVTNTSPRVSGPYFVEVSNPFGTTRSESVRLRVLNAVQILRQSQSRDVVEGHRISMSVRAKGSPQLTYRWFKNSQELVGANRARLVIRKAASLDAGTYRVVVSNSVSMAVSGEILINIVGKK